MAKKKYGTPGKLILSLAVGTPGSEDYQEPLYKIRDRPGFKEDLTIHNGEMISIYLRGRWQDAYVDYGVSPPAMKSAKGAVIALGDGQYQARIRLA